MFPKTSKKIGIGALGLVGVAILLAVVNGIQQSSNQPQPGQPTTPLAPTKPPAEPPVNERGKAIAERLEAECDYWGEIDKYNSDGTVTVRKGIYGTWGRSEAMFLPKSSWEALSSEEKRDLIDYVSRGWPDGRSVSQIIVGQVIPSPRLENSNTITVDTVVWP